MSSLLMPAIASSRRRGGSGDPFYEQRVIGLHFDSNLTDHSPSPKTVTLVGSAATTTTDPKYGVGCLATGGGTNSHALIAANSAWAFGASDYTVALWARTTTINGLLVGQFTNTPGAWALYYGGASLVWSSRYANTNLITRAVTLYGNGWNHIAVTRSGTTCRMFVNGTQQGISVTDSTNYGASGIDLKIGEQWNGGIDELLVYKGAALWTSNFTPPTGAFLNS